MSVTAAQLAAPGFTCVHFTDQAPPQAELAAAGLVLGDVGAGAVHTDEELFEALAREFEFPDSFGGSWDAVEECLRDLSWLPADAGYALIVRNAGHTWSSHPGIGARLHASWSACAEDWLGREVAFHLVFEW